MNHNIIVEQFGIRLRPVTMEDADFIYQLRRSEELSRYIGEVDPQFSVHQAWMEDYFNRLGDYYFCIELQSGEPIGTIGIYNICENMGNWGRWVILPTFPAAAASAYLIYHVAFDILELSKAYSNTIVDNQHVVSFHDNCGIPRTAIEKNGLTIKGVPYDFVIHTAERGQWPSIKKKLEAPALLAERLLQR